MSLLPSLSYLMIGSPAAPHSLELYIDYTCPYSAKLLANGVDKCIKPLISPGGKYEGKIKLIFRPVMQPWHATGTYMHEAALAVGRVAPEKWYEYTLLLHANLPDFKDIPASTMTPTQVRAKLADLSGKVIGKELVPKVQELLTLSPTGGLAVWDDYKYSIKLGRQNGIHVTPSALWDGLHQRDVSSSWAEKEWTTFFAENVKV